MSTKRLELVVSPIQSLACSRDGAIQRNSEVGALALLHMGYSYKDGLDADARTGFCLVPTIISFYPSSSTKSSPSRAWFINPLL